MLRANLCHVAHGPDPTLHQRARQGADSRLFVTSRTLNTSSASATRAASDTKRWEDKAPRILQSPCLYSAAPLVLPPSLPSPFFLSCPLPPPHLTSPLFFLLPCYFISTCHKSVPPQSSCHLCSGPLCVAVRPDQGRQADNHRLIECL